MIRLLIHCTFAVLFVYIQLVNGDLTMNYRHPGYQKMKHLSVVSRTVSAESKESSWISQIMKIVDEVFGPS